MLSVINKVKNTTKEFRGRKIMRVSRETFAANRERIVEVAGALFREKGFDGIGVADIMKAAGLTHGGFYGHFASKDDLAAEASRVVLGHSTRKWHAVVEGAPGRKLPALVDHYLSVAQRDTPGRGCAFPALGAEAARQGGAVRDAFTDGMEALVAILAGLAAGRSAAARRKRALAMFSTMVGAMLLARAVNDDRLSREILTAAADSVLA
jgi:TetR/AcrR family transcriptional repressor of nem operon